MTVLSHSQPGNWCNSHGVPAGGQVTGQAEGVARNVVDEDIVQETVIIFTSYKINHVCQTYTTETPPCRGQVRLGPPDLATWVLVDLSAGQD